MEAREHLTRIIQVRICHVKLATLSTASTTTIYTEAVIQSLGQSAVSGAINWPHSPCTLHGLLQETAPSVLLITMS